MSKEKSRKINIEIDEKTSEGIYSNLAIINHSASEFVMDFISIMPGSSKNKVKSRIIITPQHAKKLRKALNDNIDRFEQNFGSIKDYENPKFQLNFGPEAKA
jgi:predicted transcriptional regulator